MLSKRTLITVSLFDWTHISLFLCTPLLTPFWKIDFQNKLKNLKTSSTLRRIEHRIHVKRKTVQNISSFRTIRSLTLPEINAINMDNRRFGNFQSLVAVHFQRLRLHFFFLFRFTVYSLAIRTIYFHKSLVSKRIAYKVFVKVVISIIVMCVSVFLLLPNIRNKLVFIILVASGFCF